MLGYQPVVQNENEVKRINQNVASYIHFWGVNGYILTGRGAKKIISNHSKIRFQYDAYIRSLIENNKLTPYFLLPPLIKTQEKTGNKISDVQTNHSQNLKIIKFNKIQ